MWNHRSLFTIDSIDPKSGHRFLDKLMESKDDPKSGHRFLDKLMESKDDPKSGHRFLGTLMDSKENDTQNIGTFGVLSIV